MGLGGRMSTTIKAKLSRVLDKAEDPGETLDYSYQKQLENLQNVKKGIADVVTAKKRLQLQTDKQQQSIVKLDTQARQALAAGNEELARVAREDGVPGPVPVVDVLLLGVGPDGHVASLFPHHPSFEEGQRAGRSVIAVHDSPKPPPTRLSLTLPVIQAAEQVWCVVSGEDKADAVAEALAGPGDLPASRATGAQRTLWLVDEAAASKR